MLRSRVRFTALALLTTFVSLLAVPADAHVCNGPSCGCLIAPGHVHTDVACITANDQASIANVLAFELGTFAQQLRGAAPYTLLGWPT